MSPQQVAETLAPFRTRLLHILLKIALVASIPALIAGVYASIRGDSVLLVVVDIAAYLAFVVAYRLTRRKYHVAAYITVGTTLLLAITLLFLLGTTGATTAWLTGAILIAAILLEKRGVVIVFSIAFVATVVATVLLYYEMLPGRWSFTDGSQL